MRGGALGDAYEDEESDPPLKPRFRHSPCLAKPEQLSKRLFRCHRPASSRGRQAPPIPLEMTRNRLVTLQGSGSGSGIPAGSIDNKR